MVASPSGIGYQFIPFETDKRRYVCCPSQRPCNLVGEQGAIGKELEIAVGMCFKYIQQIAVHQGLPAKDTKKIAALLFAVGNNFVKGCCIETYRLFALRNPASLASQVAVIGYGYKLESREILTPFFTFPEFIEPDQSFYTQVENKLIYTPFVRSYKIP